MSSQQLQETKSKLKKEEYSRKEAEEKVAVSEKWVCLFFLNVVISQLVWCKKKGVEIFYYTFD